MGALLGLLHWIDTQKQGIDSVWAQWVYGRRSRLQQARQEVNAFGVNPSVVPA